MTNNELFELKKKIIPGGVNSPVRAFLSVGGTPRIIRKADGAYMEDIEGNRYLDFLSSWGPMILGHNHPEVSHSLQEAIGRGTSYGTPNEDEYNLAKAIVDALPAMDMVRMVSSGTEAAMTSIRLARAFTRKNKIIKIHGGYHGHADPFLVAGGSGMAALGSPNSPGVTEGTVADTLTVPFNDIPALEELIQHHKNQIAAFILEPIPGNMGVVIPSDGYLSKVREVTKGKGILLILDEVITGFRVAYEGAQGLLGVDPDLTVLGKIIGGGLPVGAVAGKREIMEMLSPSGKVYQAGTLSGNPLAMAAGKTVLEIISRPDFYKNLNQMGESFFDGLRTITKNLPVRINSFGSMGTMFFSSRDVQNYDDASASDAEKYSAFFHGMLRRGYYFAPSAYECIFISAAHTREMLERALNAADDTLKEIHNL